MLELLPGIEVRGKSISLKKLSNRHPRNHSDIIAWSYQTRLRGHQYKNIRKYSHL